MVKTSNWLARVFDWNREVIESAETPFAKLALFVLPIIAPLVPAYMTKQHVQKLMMTVFVFGGQTNETIGTLVGIVLELLGYVGAVMFIQSVYEWVKMRRAEYVVPALMNGLAYGFYLVIMYAVNYQLGVYFETPDIMNKVVGLLSFITVPTGLLAANYLNRKNEDEKAGNALRESREHSLKMRALKVGGSVASKGPRPKYASDFKDKIPVMLQEHFDKTGKVMELTDITAKLKLDHAKNKGFVSTARAEWLEKKGIKKDGSGFTF